MSDEDKLHDLLVEFFRHTDAVECSDNNRWFRPTEFHISSCRSMSVVRLDEILKEMRKIVGAPTPMTEKELYMRNDPDGCGDCLGEGRTSTGLLCLVCMGSGSMDPTVCKTCQGTGDHVMHERESNDCYTCKGTGKNPDYWCPDCNGEGWSVDCKTCKGEGTLIKP